MCDVFISDLTCSAGADDGTFPAVVAQAIGNYHSTKIWSFRMTTPCCQNKIEIHTDPKNARYIIVEGAKQKVCIHQALHLVLVAELSHFSSVCYALLGSDIVCLLNCRKRHGQQQTPRRWSCQTRRIAQS